MVLVSLSKRARGPSGILPESLLPFLQKNPPLARGRVHRGIFETEEGEEAFGPVRARFRLRDLIPLLDDATEEAINEAAADTFEYAERISPYYERSRRDTREHYKDRTTVTRLLPTAGGRPGMEISNDSRQARFVEFGARYTPPYAVIRRSAFYGSERLRVRLANKLAQRTRGR